MQFHITVLELAYILADSDVTPEEVGSWSKEHQSTAAGIAMMCLTVDDEEFKASCPPTIEQLVSDWHAYQELPDNDSDVPFENTVENMVKSLEAQRIKNMLQELPDDESEYPF